MGSEDGQPQTETLKASQSIAGGRAGSLRGAPGLRHPSRVCTLKGGCDTNRGSIFLGEDRLGSIIGKSCCTPTGCGGRYWGSRPGASRKKRALPPAVLFDAFGV